MSARRMGVLDGDLLSKGESTLLGEFGPELSTKVNMYPTRTPEEEEDQHKSSPSTDPLVKQGGPADEPIHPMEPSTLGPGLWSPPHPHPAPVCMPPITTHRISHPALSSARPSHISLPPSTNLDENHAGGMVSQDQNDPASAPTDEWTMGAGHSLSLLDAPCPNGLPDILGSSTPCMLVDQVSDCFRLQPGRAAGLVTTTLGILQTLQCAWQRLVFSRNTIGRVQAGNSIIYWLLRHWSAFRWKGPELLIPTKQGVGGKRVRIGAQPLRLEGRPNSERPWCGDPCPQKEPAELLPWFLLGVDKGTTPGHWNIEGSATPNSNNPRPTTTAALEGSSPALPLSNMEPQCCPPCPQSNGIDGVNVGTSGVVRLMVRAQKGKACDPVTWEANAERVERGQPSRIRASDSRLVVGKTLADLESTPVREALRPTTTSSLGQSATRPAAAVQKLSDQRSVERVSSELVRAGGGASLVGVDSANTMRALCVVAQSAGSTPVMSTSPASGQSAATSAATGQELSDQRSVEHVSSELVRAGGGASLVGVDSANTMRALCVVAQSAGSTPVMSTIPASGQSAATSAATGQELSDQRSVERVSSEPVRAGGGASLVGVDSANTMRALCVVAQSAGSTPVTSTIPSSGQSATTSAATVQELSDQRSVERVSSELVRAGGGASLVGVDSANTMRALCVVAQSAGSTPAMSTSPASGQSAATSAATGQELSDQRSVERVSSELVRAGGGASLVGVDSANTMRALCVVAQSAGSTPVMSTSPASGQSAATSAATGQELSDQQPGECVSSKPSTRKVWNAGSRHESEQATRGSWWGKRSPIWKVRQYVRRSGRPPPRRLGSRRRDLRLRCKSYRISGQSSASPAS